MLPSSLLGLPEKNRKPERAPVVWDAPSRHKWLPPLELLTCCRVLITWNPPKKASFREASLFFMGRSPATSVGTQPRQWAPRCCGEAAADLQRFAPPIAGSGKNHVEPGFSLFSGTLFPFVLGGCPTKNGLPKKGFLFSRVTEQLSGFINPCFLI